MVEGVGQPADKRLTNILEKDTGREYLNFACSDFGPVQYALMYKTMASKFDHDLVLVGVVPDNDFHDMDFAYRKAHGRNGEYRPFYADDLSVYYSGHFDPNAGGGFWDHVKAFLRAYLASYHIGLFVNSRLYWWRLSPYSGYHDYNSVDIARLEKSLGDIKSTAEAHGAKVAVDSDSTRYRFPTSAQYGDKSFGCACGEVGRTTQCPGEGSLAGNGCGVRRRLPRIFALRRSLVGDEATLLSHKF